MADLTIVKPEAATPLARLVDDYLAHCRARGLSVKTWRDTYRYALLEVFLPWCVEHGISEPFQLSSRVLERFTTKLLEEGGRRGQLSKASINSYGRSVKGFLSWAERGRAQGGGKGPGPQAQAQGHRRPHA